MSVSDEIARQIPKVRDTGLVNMFDRGGVSEIAEHLGLAELVDFLANKKSVNAYWNFIMYGTTENGII